MIPGKGYAEGGSNCLRTGSLGAARLAVLGFKLQAKVTDRCRSEIGAHTGPLAEKRREKKSSSVQQSSD